MCRQLVASYASTDRQVLIIRLQRKFSTQAYGSLRLPTRNRPPRGGAPLACVHPRLLARHRVGALLHDFLAFGEDELDVAGVGHVGVDLWCGGGDGSA